MDERKILYNLFLEDKRTYNLNVSYWRVQLQKALQQKILKEDIIIDNKTKDGKSFYDGNPIFSYVNPSRQKAIRVIQENPKELDSFKDIVLIDAWIDKLTVVINSVADHQIPELVISLFLTSSTNKKCLLLAKSWFEGTIDSQTSIDRLLAE